MMQMFRTQLYSPVRDKTAVSLFFLWGLRSSPVVVRARSACKAAKSPMAALACRDSGIGCL